MSWQNSTNKIRIVGLLGIVAAVMFEAVDIYFGGTLHVYEVVPMKWATIFIFVVAASMIAFPALFQK